MLNKIGVFSLLFVSTASLATSIDYRHDYLDSGKNNDSIKISHSFPNGFGASTNVKWKSGEKAFSNLKTNGHEEAVFYNYKINEITSMQPEMAIDNKEQSTSYNPSLSLTIKPESSLSLSTKYEYRVDNTNKGKDKGHALEFSGSKKIDQIIYSLKYKHALSENKIISNNSKHAHSFEGKVSYLLNKKTTTYMAIENVPGSKLTGERQSKFKVGIKYNF